MEPSPQTSNSQDSDKVYYSYSTLNNQAVCPARIYFRKLAREGSITEDVSLPLIVGSAAHLGIEHRLKHERNPFDVAKENLQEELEKKNFKDFYGEEYVERYRQLNVCLTNFETRYFPWLRESLTDPEHQVELRLEVPWRKGVLVGKIDVAMDGIFADWKTGRVAQEDDIKSNPQKAYYWHLAKMVGMPVPEEFVYVYLQGVNKAKKLSKDGKKMVQDKENKVIVTSFPTYPTEVEMNAVMRNQIIPLAKALEDGVVYKNPSIKNCKNCSYRTACLDTDLPTVLD